MQVSPLFSLFTGVNFWNNNLMLRRQFLLFSLLSLSVFGQTPTAPPPAPVIPYGSPLSTDTAKKIASAAIAEAKKNNWAMAVAIVDPSGYLVYFERMPHTQLASVEISMTKAKAAALFRRPTKFFQDSMAAGGVGLRFLQMPGVIPVDGGVPIIVDGKVVGAIGASGGTSDQDGHTAEAGASTMK